MIQDFESEKQAKMALLSKIVDKMDDESLILTSCEIRMYLLDVIAVLKTSSPVNKNAPKAHLASNGVWVGYSFKKSSKTLSVDEYCAIC